MMNVSDYNKNAQKAVSQGMETFFNWQKQALENTLTMVEEGIAVQEKNLNETRKQYQDWEQNMNRELNSQKEQYKNMVIKISESYFPESKNQIEQAEKLYEENIGGMVEKTREMVGSSIERNIETTLTLGGNTKDLLIRVIARYSLPSIIDTLRINIATSWNLVIVAELIAAEVGLGKRIQLAQRFFRTDQIFAELIVLGLIGFALDMSFRLLLRRTCKWAV